MVHRVLLLALVVISQSATEPPPRAPQAVPIRINQPLTHVSAAFELSDGRVLLTDAKAATVLLLDPAKGSLTPVGQSGGGADRYAQPGGLYAGPAGSALMIDRAQTRAFTITGAGEIAGSKSIAQKGVTGSSSEDADQQRLDAAGLVYFVDRHDPRTQQGDGRPETRLVRLEAETQRLTQVATLRDRERKMISSGDGMTIWRSFIGSPSDGWGVTPDGRVVIVRGDPYQVEWITPKGTVTRGPVIPYTALPMTEADKQQASRTLGGGAVGVGVAGGAPVNPASQPLLFAATKAPFDPGAVLVSPDARVWVLRSGPAGATDQVYDQFDESGRRVDRITLPDGARIVGFGKGSIYVRVPAASGVELRKYRTR